MKNIYIIIILFLSFTIFSCAKKSDTSSSTTATNTELEGTWLTNCFQSGSVYEIDSITVTGTDVVVKYEWYSDSSCSTDYALWEDTYDSLSIGDEITFSDDTKGHKFTLEVVSFKYTPQSSTAVSNVNAAAFCGYSDWALNTAKDYSGKTCASTAFAVANTSVQGLYNLVGNNLFLGTLNTTGSYPTGVSTSTTFVKQ
jgi:hypothetical protein